MVIVIMLLQQRSAPKRRAITLVEDFKFHTRTVGGNGTWGAMDKVLIEEEIHCLCVFNGEHSPKELTQGLQARLWSEVLAHCFPRS